MTPRPWRNLIVLLATSVALVGCPAATGSSPTRPTAGDEPEVAVITVGVLPIVDVAPLYFAIEEGLFAAEGLTVRPEVMQGGAAAIPALQGGGLDIAYGAWPSFLIANQQGIALRAVADGVAAVPGYTEFLALPNSGLEDNPAGLSGATVALNTLGNLGELALRETLADAGLDYAAVTALEMPFPEMGAALDGRSVDVIWSVEPGVTGNRAAIDAVTVIDSYVDDLESFPVAGYFVTAGFAEANPNTVAAFTRAIQSAAAVLNGDRDARIEIVQTYTELPRSLLEDVIFPEYRGELDAAPLERVYKKMLEHRMAEGGLDIDSLVLD